MSTKYQEVIVDLNDKISELLIAIDEHDHAFTDQQLVRVAAGQYLRRDRFGYVVTDLDNASFFSADGLEATFVSNLLHSKGLFDEPVISVTHEEALAEVVALLMAKVATVRACVGVLLADSAKAPEKVYTL